MHLWCCRRWDKAMAGKRGNGEGTIRKRSDGRWEARLVLPDGTRKSLFGKTRQEVTRLLAQAIRDRETGLTALTDRQTVAQYLASWLDITKHTIGASTHLRYTQNVRAHLIPEFGDTVLTKLTAQQVQALYLRKREQGLATGTVHNIHVLLHAALDDAVRLGVVYRNVADMVDSPKTRRKKMTTLTDEQARLLLAAVMADRLKALLVLALATGMREGELGALTWADVDLEGASLIVRATVQDTAAGWIIAERPKTDHGRRRIALAASAIEALRRHRLAQLEERSQLGEAWQDRNLVFSDATGGLLSRRIFKWYGWFGRMLKRAGLPRVRFHDLRHTMATLLLERGVHVKVVSEMLGHSSIAVTLDMYGHVTPHMQQRAIEAMDRLLGE